MKTLKIIYTSDTHGRLTSYDFVSQTSGPFGLTRLSSYLKALEEPYLLLDNGDFLQGSPLLDYARKEKEINPVATMFNAIKYPYVTVGNHDFNFGLHVLNDFEDQFQGKIICANIYKDNKPYFTPYVIHEVAGKNIAVIGVTTEYIPFWERKENIEGLEFRDVVKTVKEIITEHKLKERSDLIVVLYHGGFEKDMKTGEPFGRLTVENKGYELFQIKEVDLLLTGHQHISQIHEKEGRMAIQTSHNGFEAGVIDVTFDNGRPMLKAQLLKLVNYPVDHDKEMLLDPLIEKTNQYLSQPVGMMSTDMTITSPLSARITKHPLFQLINEVQRAYTNAEISCSSLPNDTRGLPKEVTLRDIFLSFPFENDLVVLEVTGEQLIRALEQNATYFTIQDDEVVINPKFLFPKVEHYNYDVYDGIEYIIHVDQPIGKKISGVRVNGKPIVIDKVYTLALNSYRATGAGGFDVFQEAKIVHTYPVSYVDMISNYIQNHDMLTVNVLHNFRIVKGE